MLLAAPGGEPGARRLLGNSLKVTAVAAALALAALTSGLVAGRHHVDPVSVDRAGDKLHQYRVQGLPFGLVLARDEERTLVPRTVISDAKGPLVPGQNDTRIEEMPGGRSSFWARTANLSFREPGGPAAPANALTMEGSLRPRPNLVMGLIAAILLGALASGLVLRRAAPAKVPAPVPAPGPAMAPAAVPAAAPP